MRRRLTWGLALLRVTGCTALLLLLWNPVSSRLLTGAAPPLVLLDASLSMAGHGGRWREALDSARALARGGVIWRFGARVAAFDSAPPSDGASLLGPAIAAAAARGGPVAVVTDGSVSDVASIAPDLLRRLRIVVLPRPDFHDAFVAAVRGPHRIAATDTLRLTVTYGVLGTGDEGRGKGKASLVVTSEGRRLASRDVSLPDSGIVSTDLTLPASRFPHPGWWALDVRLEGASDSEPRDDARLFVVEVNPSPSVVVLASPPDWDLRFFARTLADVAQVPVRVFVETEPGGGHPAGGRWRDAATLAPASPAELKRALAGARLVVEGGDPAGFGRVSAPADRARLLWPTAGGLEGEWYVDAPPPSPLAAGLGGLAWDSLAPAVGVMPTSPDSATVVALTARLARRGPARPVVLLSERRAVRRAEIAAVGLYRWAFRGGASAEAYRALVAELANWLLEGEGGRGKGERATPEAVAVANGLRVVWRWTGSGTPHDLPVTLSASAGERRDTLRFDATGEATLLLPPGVYRYALDDGPERGVVAVETYSDEWRPDAPVLRRQPGAPAGRFETVTMRDRWWLFVLAMAAFTVEWAWRRRQGLP
jgi:hypothetical protein